MIVKNGEILAIDHIAHDNTLSGNGTSAKPVGLSQSTKDLIDSKVKKTDFETYKSSAANQISNINTKITTDESNFNSYKSSAHNEIANFKSSAHDEIARVDASIAAVDAAKVDKTTFTQYQTDVANSFTAVNKRIDDVDAVDEKVDDLKTELETEYYDANTIDDILAASGSYYTQSQVDEKLEEYVKSTELEPINEKIDSVSAEFNKYYTKTEVDDEFTTKDTFDNTITDINNDLADIVETVSAIDQDKADKSDLNDYYKISETSGRNELSAEFAKYTKTEDLHIPTTVAELTDSGNYYTTAETSGKNQLSAAFDAILKYNVTAAAGIEVTTATDAGVKTFGISMTAEPVVTDTTLSGYNGIAATRDATISNQWNIGLTQDMLNTIDDKLDSSDAARTYLTKTDAANTYQEIGNYLENTDIELDANNKITGISGKELVITAHQSLANYYTKSDVDAALTNKVDTSELETVSGEIVNMIPSLDGYATESWVENKHYLVANDIAGKADKTDLQYVSAGVDYVSGHIPSLNGYATEQYVQGASAEVTAWVNNQDFLKSVPDIYALKSDIPTTVAQLTDSANYYTINQTSAASELTTEFAKYTKTEDLNIPSKVTDLSDSANYVVTGDILTGAGNKLTGIKVGSTNYTIPTTDLSDYYTKSETSASEELNAEFANKVDIPDTTQTDLNNNYLIYSTLTGAGTTTGWMPLSANYYSKSEADGRYQKKEDMSSYLTTAQYETDSAKYVSTGDILTAANDILTGIKIGNTNYNIPDDYAKQTGNYQNLSAGSATSAYSAYSASYATTAASAYIDADTISAMSDIVDAIDNKLDSTVAEQTYLPLSGGTVSGQLVVSGDGTFDQENLKFIRSGQNGYGRIELASNGALAVKVDDNNSNTTQINVAANASYNELVQVQHGGTTAYLIPAVTATTTDGLTNDGILHIILDS